MAGWQAALLIAATITTGLSAGLLSGFGYAVMPGLRRVDDRSLVAVMQQINVAIINPLFVVIFFGPLLFSAAAAIAHLPDGDRAALPWILGALLLYLATLVITVARNVPLNNLLDAAGPPDQVADLAAVRRRFEPRWVRWNLIRSLTATIALGCLAIALYVSG